MASLHEAYAAAADHLEAGRLPEAELIAQRILEATPGQMHTLRLLAEVYTRAGLAEEARTCHGQALTAGLDAAAVDDRRVVIFDWSVSSFFGWGVYGINLALAAAAGGRFQPLCAWPINPESLVLSALERRALTPFLAQSEALVRNLAPFAGEAVRVSVPVLLALGNNLTGNPVAHNVRLRGASTIGVVFMEQTTLSATTRAEAAAMDLLVAGSTWNRQVLESAGLNNVVTVLQGVDPTLFHPGPRGGWLRDRFTVFSGGKLEYRKGQDLVLSAFRVFAQRHPKALLVTAWHSPWPAVAKSLAGIGHIAPVPQNDQGQIDVVGWAVANGIAAEQVLDLGTVANAQMPRLLREMDVALFANRAEAGTNLVAMECMACGVPVILSANTGHLDLIGDDTCLSLTRQRPIPDGTGGMNGTDGWGESEIEEMVEALECSYQNRAAAIERGARGAALLAGLSWRTQIERLLEAIMPKRSPH
ncbi:Glycosyltransferase [uncultured Gammaproteobacteria bacterium]